MRFIQISPVRHLRADAFDEVVLRGARIVFNQARGPFINLDFGETGDSSKTDAGIHAERQYARLMEWLASGETGLFIFEPAPKGPDAGCVAVESKPSETPMSELLARARQQPPNESAFV